VVANDNPGRARTFIVELTVHFRKIADLKLMHEVDRDLGPDVRRAVHGNYNIYYRFINEDALIIRVLHNARDKAGMSFD
jgi:toxin ParE1/3/4